MRRCQAQLPINRGRMCTLTNENVIPFTCITTEAVNTNNVLILIFIFLRHGFLRDRCSISRQTHVRSKGIGMVIYPPHELRLRAGAAKVQIGEQPFQITSQRLLDQSQAGVYRGKRQIAPHFGLFGAIHVPYPKGLNC